MAKSTALPERLKYLQPFRKEFQAHPEELEGEGMEPMLRLFGKRIARLSEKEAEKLLEEDIGLLKEWLSSPERATDCLHFVAGVLYIASPADLVAMIAEELRKDKPPLPWVEMELWPGVKPRRFEKQRDGGMLVKWKGFMVAIYAAPYGTETIGRMPLAIRDRRKVTSFPVQFGEVTGTKYVELYENRSKRIIYVLIAPGGVVEANVDFFGKSPNAKSSKAEWDAYNKRDDSTWDETPIESFFHTLRLVSREV